MKNLLCSLDVFPHKIFCIFFTKMEIILGCTLNESFSNVQVLLAREFREVLLVKTDNAIKHCKRNVFMVI